MYGVEQAYWWDLNTKAVVATTGADQGKHTYTFRDGCANVLLKRSSFTCWYSRDISDSSTDCTCSIAVVGAVLAVAHKPGTQGEGSVDQFATAGVDGSVMFWEYAGDSSEYTGSASAEL